MFPIPFYLQLIVVPIVLFLYAGDVAAENNRFASPPDAFANTGDPTALFSLAVKYEHAEGVPRDYGKAVTLYCAAARSGYAEAQYALGWMYANGRGVAKDDAVAARLFLMAAEQGHLHAREMSHYLVAYSEPHLPACLEPVTETSAASGKNEELERQAGMIFPRGIISKLVEKLAPRYEVDPNLAMAVISVESGFNVQAKSPKNAQGLMQLTPDTAHRFRVKNAFDAEDNIKGGLAYLRWLLAFFKGNVPLVAAAYNAGERAVETHRGVPPYPETRDYVRKITKLYKKSDHPYQRDLVEASSVVMRPVSDAN